MIRLPMALTAAGLLWAVVGHAADDPKPDTKPAAKAETKPTAKTEAKPAASPQAAKINELIAKGWESAGIKKPADKASDAEYMRRAFIDLIGRIPTPEEVIDFERDSSQNKKAKLINRLLNDSGYKLKDRSGKALKTIPGLKTGKDGEIDYNSAYAENLAELWTTWLLTRSNTNPAYRGQLHFWLNTALVNDGYMTVSNGGKPEQIKAPFGTPWNQIVYHLISDTGKSNEVGSVVFVIRHLGEPIAEMGKGGDFGKDGKFDGVPITSRVTKLFLGIQSQCTQCHDHPFNKEYVQSDFWGVNAFFRQANRSGTTNPNARNLMGATPQPLALNDEGGWNTPGMVLYERRDGQRKATFPAMLKNIEQAAKGEPTSKRLVSGSIPPELQGKTRREILAHWVTEHDNFGRAFVNRMWGHLFGRGLNKEPTVDDFSSNNEVVHPELLDYLAEEFKKYNYDPKKLLEWICTSDVYQLSHVANKAYTDQKYDPYFARMPLKAMSPEVMFEALAIATRAESRLDEKAYKALKAAWVAKLTQNFGDDEGNEINFNGTVVQALLMMNGKELNGEIGKGAKGDNGVIADLAKKVGNTNNYLPIYDQLFLMTVNRHVTKVEFDRLESVRHGTWVQLGPSTTTPPKGKGPAKGPNYQGGAAMVGPSAGDVAYFQDVFWALVNSNEFMLNH